MANFQIKDLGSDSNPLGTDLFLKSAANGALTKTTFSALKDAINNEQNDALAIVANGNTHPAITSGQFVYVRNHSSLAEGLYKATAAIGTNATLSTSNLTADGSGGLNDLQAQVTSLNSNSTSESFAVSLSGISADLVVFKTGKICRMHFNLGDGTVFSGATGYDTIGSVPQGYRPNHNVATELILGRTAGVWASATYFPMIIRIETNGDLVISGNANELKQCQYLSGELFWTTG